jgi:phosphoribosyl 1,2-cyclic phosphate phosphodiesterase
MRVTFLGTGTSHGIPRIGCDCAVCQSDDFRNKRLRASILVEHEETMVLVDATPDFRQQALRVNLRRLDAVLLTHSHADHILGLDDLRVFTEAGKLPVIGSGSTIADVGRMFPYACTEKPAWRGMPSFELRAVGECDEFVVGNLRVETVPVLHGRMTVLGFVFNRQFAYVTDCNEVLPEAMEVIRGVPLLAIDGLRHRPHVTHLTVARAVAVAQEAGAQQAWLTHLCHELDHAETELALPAGVRVAYDGLQVEL